MSSYDEIASTLFAGLDFPDNPCSKLDVMQALYEKLETEIEALADSLDMGDCNGEEDE